MALPSKTPRIAPADYELSTIQRQIADTVDALLTQVGAILNGSVALTVKSIITTTINATGAFTGTSVAASGTVSGANLVSSGAISGANLTVTGAITGASLGITGAATVGGTLGVTGAITGAGYSGGAISGTTGAFTGTLTGVNGTFSGAVSANSVVSAAGFKAVVGPFTYQTPVAGVTSANMGYVAGDGAGVFAEGTLKWIPPFSGSILGISAFLSATGTNPVAATITSTDVGGGSGALAVTFILGNALAMATTTKGLVTFAAGDQVGIRVTWPSNQVGWTGAAFLLVEMGA